MVYRTTLLPQSNCNFLNMHFSVPYDTLDISLHCFSCYTWCVRLIVARLRRKWHIPGNFRWWYRDDTELPVSHSIMFWKLCIINRACGDSKLGNESDCEPNRANTGDGKFHECVDTTLTRTKKSRKMEIRNGSCLDWLALL